LLDEPATEKIIASGLDEIIITLNAAENQEIYNLIRNGVSIGLFKENIWAVPNIGW